MKRIKVLEGEKVALVVPEREDVEVWYRWINNLENQIFLAQRTAENIFNNGFGRKRDYLKCFFDKYFFFW